MSCAVVVLWKTYGPADVCSELISVEARGIDVLASNGVVDLRQRIVAIELPQCPVIGGSSLARHHVHLSTGRASHFSRVRARFDLELSQRVN